MKNKLTKEQEREVRKRLRKAYDLAASTDDKSDVECLIDACIWELARQKKEIDGRRWQEGADWGYEKAKKEIIEGIQLELEKRFPPGKRADSWVGLILGQVNQAIKRVKKI